MAEVTGAGYVLAIDLLSGTTYVDADVVTIDESFNETIDTYYKLSDGGNATNVVTAIDPQYTMTIKGDSADTLITGIYEKRFSVGSGREFTFEITDNLTSETVTGKGTFTAIAAPRNIGEVVQITVSFKLVGAPTVA